MPRLYTHQLSVERGVRVWVFAALIAVIGAGLVSVASTSAVGSAASSGASPGVVGVSMVEMLDQDGVSTPMTLDEVRRAVRGYIEPSVDGSGIDVALIDTGVAPVQGLDAEDKVLHGPDLSDEGSVREVAFLDTYGHGTHMAGIIAGDREGQQGIAPGSRLVSIKAAGHDGITTVPQVVAAIDWVIEHRNTDGLNIRVLNLSLGQEGVSDHVGDYLSAAVERAWDAGIFVVVAAGNRGETQKHLDSPAIDPYVLAVGAHDLYADRPVDSTSPEKEESAFAEPVTPITDEQVTLSDSSFVQEVDAETSLTTEQIDRTRTDDTGWLGGVPVWSANGDGQRNPDLIAAGRSIASYRVPGSTVDEAAPGARYGDDLFLGSGTSQSAAVTSGVAALILQAYPKLAPDQLKATMSRTAVDLWTPAERDGNGILNGRAAATGLDIKRARQEFPPAAGPGTGIAWPSGATWTGGTWTGGTWTGATWTGATWTGGTWTGATWTGATWTGATWTGATWTGGTWTGGTWTGGTWTGGGWR